MKYGAIMSSIRSNREMAQQIQHEADAGSQGLRKGVICVIPSVNVLSPHKREGYHFTVRVKDED